LTLAILIDIDAITLTLIAIIFIDTLIISLLHYILLLLLPYYYYYRTTDIDITYIIAIDYYAIIIIDY
jgi:hypothetical protein